MSNVHPEWAYMVDGDNWVVYDTYEDAEYGNRVIGEELARSRSIGEAVRRAELAIKDKARRDEQDRIAREFEEQIFGPTASQQLSRMFIRDMAEGLRQSVLFSAQMMAQHRYVDAPSFEAGSPAEVRFRQFNSLAAMQNQSDRW